MEKLMKMAQSVAMFRSMYMKTSLNAMADSGSIRVLIFVNNFEGGTGVRPHQVADYFHCSRPYVSKVVKRLFDKKYIERIPDRDDSRSSILVTSEQGKHIVLSIMDEYLEITARLYRGLGEKKSDTLMALLDESVQILEKDSVHGGKV